VPLADAQAFAESLGPDTVCFETSAKTGENVEAVFDHVGEWW
jgi:hypothetical protein